MKTVYLRTAQKVCGDQNLDKMWHRNTRVAQACDFDKGLHHRLVEDADFRAAQELFGGQDLDKMQPKSAKDFEDFAATLAHKYVLGHAKSAHYKNLVKALFKVSSGTTDILPRLGMLTQSVILEHNGPECMPACTSTCAKRPWQDP